MDREEKLKQLQEKRDSNEKLLLKTLDLGYEIDAGMFLKLRLDMVTDYLVSKGIVDEFDLENHWEDLISSILNSTLASDFSEEEADE
jgi:hypothetical protein